MVFFDGFCKKNHVKLMLTSVPHYWQYAGNDDGTGKPRWSYLPHHEIANIAEEEGVPYLNSFNKLKDFIVGTPQDSFYYKNNMHFNPRGYKIWSKAHLDFLKDKKNSLLPEDIY